MATAETTSTQQGIIDASARVLRELIRTPKVRQTAQVLISSFDPDNAPKLVDAVMEDPLFTLDLAAKAPSLVNAAGRGGKALLSRLHGYPPRLLRGFSAKLIAQLEPEQLGAAVGLAFALAMRLRNGDNDLSQELMNFSDGLARGISQALIEIDLDGDELIDSVIDDVLIGTKNLAARLGPESTTPGSKVSRRIEMLTSTIRQLGVDHPDFVTGIVQPLLEAIREMQDPSFTNKNAQGDKNAR